MYKSPHIPFGSEDFLNLLSKLLFGDKPSENQNVFSKFIFISLRKILTRVSNMIMIRLIKAAVIVVNNFACVRMNHPAPPYITETREIR